jgi:hypothetical protein
LLRLPREVFAMRNFGVTAVLLFAVACAVQNNPMPTGDDDDDSVGSGGSAGTSSGGTASSGTGNNNKAGTTTGGKPSAGSGGMLDNMAGDGAGGTASGGKAGSGGSGGKTSGGSGGSGGKASGGAGGSGSGIGAQLALYNTGQSTLNLADLKIRYYLTNEVQAGLNRNINWAWYRPIAGGGQDDKKPKVSFSVVPMTCKTATADSYLEFVFTADAGLLEPAHYLLFSWTANNGSNQNFTQSNDYSFDTTSKVDADDSKIVVLQMSGTRVWGTEP